MRPFIPSCPTDYSSVRNADTFRSRMTSKNMKIIQEVVFNDVISFVSEPWSKLKSRTHNNYTIIYGFNMDYSVKKKHYKLPDAAQLRHICSIRKHYSEQKMSALIHNAWSDHWTCAFQRFSKRAIKIYQLFQLFYFDNMRKRYEPMRFYISLTAPCLNSASKFNQA